MEEGLDWSKSCFCKVIIIALIIIIIIVINKSTSIASYFHRAYIHDRLMRRETAFDSDVAV